MISWNQVPLTLNSSYMTDLKFGKMNWIKLDIFIAKIQNVDSIHNYYFEREKCKNLPQQNTIFGVKS